MMDAKRPTTQFRAGPVSCAVWENQIDVDGQTRTILKATVARRYRDKSGAWQSTHSFSLADIPLVVHVLKKAFEAMVQTSAAEDPTNMPPEQEPE